MALESWGGGLEGKKLYHFVQILKAVDTIDIITQNSYYYYNTLLGNRKGELLIVYNIVRNGSLWSDVVIEKEVIFHEFNFETP